MDMTRLTTTPLQQSDENISDVEKGRTLNNELNINDIPTLKLKQFFKDIETELKHRDVTDKKKALERMRDIAAEYGLSLSEVINKEGRLDTKKPKLKNEGQNSKPKYINPDNPDQTWSGRGQKPKWLKEALKEGLTLEELAANSELPSPKVESGESQPVLSA